MNDVHTLAGAYALNAIDDLDRARFDRHLAECPACAAEVAELTETVAAFAEAVAEAPPAAMRAAVLDQVAETPQLPRDVRRTSGRRAMHRRHWLAAAAAVVALGGAGTAGYSIANHGAGTRADNEASRIAAVLGAPDARTRTTPTGGGQVSVIASASLDEAVAVLTDLPAPGPGRAYQLWVIRDSTPRSVAVLAAGRVNTTQLVSGVRGAQAFGVSREPAGGSATPTMPLVAQLALG